MQSLETKSSRPRPKSFETETETRRETFETDNGQWFIVSYDSANKPRPRPSLETPSLVHVLPTPRVSS